MKNDFSTTTQTKNGIRVQNLKFNSIPNLWLGQVWEPGWAINAGKETQWVTCSWKKSGKCANPNRTDLDLK